MARRVASDDCRPSSAGLDTSTRSVSFFDVPLQVHEYPEMSAHEDIVGMVREHQFRSDLYFSISTIPLTIPALRDRLEGIPNVPTTGLSRLID